MRSGREAHCGWRSVWRSPLWYRKPRTGSPHASQDLPLQPCGTAGALWRKAKTWPPRRGCVSTCCCGAQHSWRSKSQGSHRYRRSSAGPSCRQPSHRNRAPPVATSLSACSGWAGWVISDGTAAAAASDSINMVAASCFSSLSPGKSFLQVVELSRS